MIKTILIGGLAVSVLTYFLNGSGNRLRGSSSSTGSSRVRYGPPYLPPGKPLGSNGTSPEPHFRIILSANQNRNKSTVSPQSILNGSLSNNQAVSNYTGSVFLTPPSLGMNNVSSDGTTTAMPQPIGNNGSSSSNSSQENKGPILITQEDIAGQGIVPEDTATPAYGSTTVSYIKLRSENTYNNSSTEPTVKSSLSDSMSSTAVPSGTSEEQTTEDMSRQSDVPLTQQTQPTRKDNLITSTTEVSDDLLRTSGVKQDLRSGSTTQKLSLSTQTATDRSISYLPVSTSQPKRIVTQTVTEHPDYIYYYVESSGEENNSTGHMGSNPSSSSGYLPPAQPATSLRLPNTQQPYDGYSLSANVNQSSPSSSGVRNYSTSPGRIPATYLPPSRV